MWRREFYPVYHFYYSYLSNRLIIRFFKNLWSQKSRTNIRTQKSWIKQKSKKRWRGWPKLNYTNNLKEMSWRDRLMKSWDGHPRPRGIEVRWLRPRPKLQIQKPITTSRSGAVNYRDISSILDRDTCTSSPGRWSNWISTLARPIAIAAIQPSWQRNNQPSPTRRLQQSLLTRASSVPRLTQRRKTSKRRTLMRPSVRNWGIKMCMKPTCTRSATLLWVRTMINFSIRWNCTAPYSQSRQSKTLSDNWWSSRSSSYWTDMNNTPSGLHAWQPGNCTT